jgi:DNA repair protein RadC
MEIQKFNLVMEKAESYSLFGELIDVHSPEQAYVIAKSFGLHKQAEEVFAVAGFDSSGRVNSYFEVHRGAVNRSLVSPREIFKRLFLANATDFVVFHNHPSGYVNPSPADIDMTKELKKLANALDMTLMDHLIVGDDKYYSFMENQIL